MEKITINNIEFLRFNKIWNKINDVDHFITTRQNIEIKSNYDGFNMCDYTGDNPDNVKECRRIFSAINNIEIDSLFFPRQVHGDDILIIESKEEGLQQVKEKTFDAVITPLKGICIGVSTADCVPILLYDKEKKIIAAIHAGWRGTVKHIVSKTVKAMSKRFGSDPNDIIAGVGPSISQKNFEVGPEVPAEFLKAGFDKSHISDSSTEGKYIIDLWSSNKQDLIDSGVTVDNIEMAEICTVDNFEMLFSARKLGINSGRITTCIMIQY